MRSKVLRIPKDRIKVIGKAMQAKIEKRLGVKLGINQEVKISSEDPLSLLKAELVIKAIGRGFSPIKALELSKEGVSLRIMNISDYAKTRKAIKRLKGRVIGKGGKARKTLENITNTYISVYGKSISIIGEAENILKAWKAINMLLEGRKHQTVYRYLENE